MGSMYHFWEKKLAHCCFKNKIREKIGYKLYIKFIEQKIHYK